MNQNQITALADRLIAAYEKRQTLEPITASCPEFDVSTAYAVLHEIHSRREANGWSRCGRKIGFTNRHSMEKIRGGPANVGAYLFAHRASCFR